MKSIKRYFKSIAIVLSVIIFLQGCSVYKPTPITLEQAEREGLKVKVITKSNEALKFNRISLENGIYYGNKRLKGKIFKTPIEINTIDYIKEKNKTISTIGTITASIIILFSFVVGTWLLAGSPL